MGSRDVWRPLLEVGRRAPPRALLAVAITGQLLVGLLMGVMILLPAFNGYMERGAERERRAHQKKLLFDARQRVLMVKEKVRQLQGAQPDHASNHNTALLRLHALLRQAGLLGVSVEWADSERELRVEARGSFHGVLMLLELLAADHQGLIVMDVSVSSRDKEDGSLSLRLRAKLVAVPQLDPRICV